MLFLAHFFFLPYDLIQFSRFWNDYWTEKSRAFWKRYRYCYYHRWWWTWAEAKMSIKEREREKKLKWWNVEIVMRNFRFVLYYSFKIYSRSLPHTLCLDCYIIWSEYCNWILLLFHFRFAFCFLRFHDIRFWLIFCSSFVYFWVHSHCFLIAIDTSWTQSLKFK